MVERLTEILFIIAIIILVISVVISFSFLIVRNSEVDSLETQDAEGDGGNIYLNVEANNMVNSDG